MNDIERTLVDIDFKISDCENKEVKIYDKYLGVKQQREEVQNRVNNYGKKIERLNEELDNLKVLKTSILTVPSIGFACFGFALLFSAPVALTVGVTVLGGATGYKLANDMVRYKMINKSDETLLIRLFPSIAKKHRELLKVNNARKNCEKKVESLSEEEALLKEEYDDLVLGHNKLNESKEKALNLLVKKLRKEYLPYFTDNKDLLDKVIRDPEYFYRTVCRELKSEERKDIVRNMKGKSCENCQNYSCRLSQDEKANITNCNAWYNEVEIGMSKILKR